MTSFVTRLLATLAVICGLTIGLAPATAQESPAAARVQDLGARSFSKIIKAVNALAATGEDGVTEILEAYLARKLYVQKSTKRVVFAKPEGEAFQIFEPLTRKALGPAKSDDLKKLRLNNRVRRTIHAAVGGLTLQSKDPAKRIKAADAIFKAPKAEQLAILQKAVDGEQDASVKPALQRALAAARLAHGGNSKERLAAISSLGQFADPQVSARLKSLLVKDDKEKFIEPDAAVRKAAEAALFDLEERIAIWDFVGKVFTGVSLASVLLLAAIGLAITFGVMGVINMAHGEMVMIGAYTTFVIQEIIRTSAPSLFDASLFFAIPAAFLVAGAFGVAIERGIIRFLYGRPLETLLATWGISLILQQMVRTIFGPTNREVGNPSWMSGAIQLDGGALLTYNRIWIIVFSIIVVVLLALVLKKTAFGLRMRAVTQNRRMASAMGIRTGWVDAMTFGLGSGIAGMAGVALSQIDNVSPNLGQAYIVDSFMVVVFGGVGNLLGTVFGALTLGLANKFLEAWSGAVLAKILVLIAVILFIQKRPRGMFALKGRAADG
jgi:urea transport system permease protein